MAEFFEEVDVENTTIELDDNEEIIQDNYQISSFEARRRLENILAEKKLKHELEDFLEN